MTTSPGLKVFSFRTPPNVFAHNALLDADSGLTTT